MPDEKRPDRDRGAAPVKERKPKTKRPRMYRVVFHNDDYTTMEFVVWVLRKVFHLPEPEATHVMLTVHHKGKSAVGSYTKDIAESKVAQTLALAEQHGMPLMVTSEPE